MILETLLTMGVELIKHIVYTLVSLIFIFLFKKLYFKYIESRIQINFRFIKSKSIIETNIFINDCNLSGCANTLYPEYKLQFDGFNDYGIIISLVNLTEPKDSYYPRLTTTIPMINIPIIDYIKILIQLIKIHICSKMDKLNYKNDYFKINLSKKLKRLIINNFDNKMNEKING
jgi:hypothetical protein